METKAQEALLRIQKTGKEGIESSSFKLGCVQALLDLQQEKEVKQQRKNGKVIPEDFCYLSERDNRQYKQYVHYEEGKAVVTDGHFLVALAVEYPEEKENKNFLGCKGKKDTLHSIGEECKDIFYPKWKKAVPDLSSYVTAEDGLRNNLVKAAKMEKSVKVDRQEKTVFELMPDFKINAHIAKTAAKFITLYPECSLLVHSEDALKCFVLEDEKSGSVYLGMPQCQEVETTYKLVENTFIKVN